MFILSFYPGVSKSLEIIGYSKDEYKLMIFAIKEMARVGIQVYFPDIKVFREKFCSSPTKKNLRNWFNALNSNNKTYWGIFYSIVKIKENGIDKLSLSEFSSELLIEDILE